MDIEIDNDCRDITCPKCKSGIFIFCEDFWDGEEVINCPKCNKKITVVREVISKYKIK